jgi:AcrR family transcriptional regulator
MNGKRTQTERSTATRAALVAAARPRFAERGYAAVGTPELAAAAGVTRGALYHQFTDKRALFAAVAEEVEAEVTRALAAAVMAAAPHDPLEALHVAIDAWLDSCEDPEVRQVLLIDGPAVLGWEELRDLLARYGLGLTVQLVQAGISAGRLPDLDATALAHVLLGALQEAGLVVAVEPAARPAVLAALRAVVDGLARDPAP